MEFGDNKITENSVIIKTKYSFIFTNIRPFLPYHILISPISKKERLVDLTVEEHNDLFMCARLSLFALQELCTGSTVNVQDGVCAGQKVMHVHIHIVPRNENDLEKNDLIYAEGALDYSRRTRGNHELEEEEAFLRDRFVKTFTENDYDFVPF